MKLDLVLEGGGVKGIALVGALSVLEKEFEFHRVAGSSAGAIVGSLTAAGMNTTTMQQVIGSLDYRQFMDKDLLDHFGLAGKTLSVLFEKGLYKGDFLEKWLGEQLATVNVSTFGDLADDDDDTGSSSAEPAHAYKLVVTASDISNGRLALLPIDFPEHYPTEDAGGGANTRTVVEAVRCSMSIPFFFQPHHLGYRAGPKKDKADALMVDGGMLSNFPVQVFDRKDTKPPRWPTFGIKLSNRPGVQLPPAPINGPIDFARSLLNTMMGFADRAHIEDPKVVSRTIFVDSLGVSATDFDAVSTKPELREALFQSGVAAATRFLHGDGTPDHPPWSFDSYVTQQQA